MERPTQSRRDFLIMTGLASSSALISTQPLFAKAQEKKEETEVGPAEDLMREHGGLNRILLIYEEGIRRIEAKKSIDLSVLQKSSGLIKSFIEGYHEKLEEEYIFPRLKKNPKYTQLVETLDQQHQAGRKVTAMIQGLSVAQTLKNESDQSKLLASLRAFIRMYRPHEAREDTILFPAFHESLSEKDYDALGDKFEDREHQLFGKEGFEGVVEQIAGLEKTFGIYDLAQFTPDTK